MRKKLKRTREEKGLTQVQVAEYLDIASVNYQNIEAGRNGTSEERWLRLFDLFEKKIPLNELMENS